MSDNYKPTNRLRWAIYTPPEIPTGAVLSINQDTRTVPILEQLWESDSEEPQWRQVEITWKGRA